MSFQDNDQPLGQQFLQNPYEYFQSFVRNMNNEVFLSEYQLGHLYSLLLLKKQSPWDQLKPNSQTLKTEIQSLVNAKVIEVKKMLQSLSQIYQNKLKKNTFTQIERLMSILKAKNKSIFIEKDFHFMPEKIKAQGKMVKNLLQQQQGNQLETKEILEMQKQKKNSLNQKQCKDRESQMPMNTTDFSCQTQERNENLQQQKIMQQQQKQENQMQIEGQPMCSHNHSHSSQHETSQHQCQSSLHAVFNQNETANNGGDEREVLSLFYGIANIPNLSSLALGNCLEYSAAERYIKFQMSKNYIMTIKNDDELSFDRSSVLKNVSSDLFIHNIFPYLTAVQLFKSRAVCKEWMQNVKQAWHSTFKREMFVQLMACEFCKQIQFYYKMIQLRNPFFQKVSLLMHALIEIIQWQRVNESINNGTIAPQLKKVLIILLKLLGEPIVTPNLNSITQELWQQHKQKTLTLKQRLTHFLNNIESSGLSIIELMKIKVQLLDDPFMRVQELNSEDKTPLLLVIFIKQLTLQQILKNHIYFSQEYLMNTKKRLDNISSKMPQQKGFLEGVYKIILLRSFGSKSQESQNDKEQKSEMPNFASILSSIFDGNQDMNKPDFVLKSKSSLTNIYMDKGTKLDIIVSTVKKMNAFQQVNRQQHRNDHQQEQQEFQQNNKAKMKSEQQLSNPLIDNQNQTNFNSQTVMKNNLKTVNIYNINVNQQQKNNQDSLSNLNKSNIQNKLNQDQEKNNN